jgi:hypothetical protein
MKAPTKRAEVTLTSVPGTIIILVVLAILLGIGASILLTTSQVQCAGAYNATSTYAWNNTASACIVVNASGYQTLPLITAGPVAYQTSVAGLSGMNTFSQWLPTIAVVLAAAIVIGLVLAYLVARRQD